MPLIYHSGHKPWIIDLHQLNSGLISDLESLFREGGLAVYPTETFYALGGVPSLTEVSARIFEIKGRDFRKPLPLIASGREAVMRAVSAWSEAAERLANAFWPGPLTLILPAAPSLPPLLHAGTGKVAIRISSHPLASSLAGAAGGLLVSTSANSAGEPPPDTPGMIPDRLLKQVDAFLVAGDLAGGFPSTIVDVTVHPPVLVRGGRIGWDEILNALGADFTG
ncbi:MAG: L-threonylcarbamoyladenylate synthase [Syntrophobacteraceae bacterium]